DKLLQQLRALPEGDIYEQLANQQLRRLGDRVPSAILPQLDWYPLNFAFEPTLPVSSYPGEAKSQVPLRLVRDTAEKVVNVLLVPFHVFARWCDQAPEFRLNRLRFAVRNDCMTIVHGHPLPPILGELFVEQEGLVFPAGWTWSPAIPATMLRKLLQLEEGDLCIARADTPGDSSESELPTLEHVSSSQFVHCQRSAIRATLASLSMNQSGSGGAQ
ncbi:MAG: hypothetical protein KDA69_13800, partial [Planctomycetaceae bacterium]|nr:hypothetical protein [Planctomycetaceae bacterium]